MRTATLGVGFGMFAAMSAVTTWMVLRDESRQEDARDDDLPGWFGDAHRPAARIAGKVFGAHRMSTVHLLLDIPDPALWRGQQVHPTASGEFDFGPMRAGSYLLFVEGDGALSRLSHVDTLQATGEHIELFAYDRSTVETNLTRFQGHLHGDWDLPDRIANGERITSPTDLRMPLVGVVVLANRSPASGVGVQPVRCAYFDHDLPTGLPTISAANATGEFVLFLGDPNVELCGLRIWNGPQIHEVTLSREYRQPVAVRLPEPVRLPEQGREQRGVFDVYHRVLGDPRGAWIRGRVVRNGKGIGDVDVNATVLTNHMMQFFDETRSRSDGSFELYVASRALDESSTVTIDAEQAMQRLGGRQVVHVSAGESRDRVTIEIGAGVVVSGVVVDEIGAPVPGVKVACEAWQQDGKPTGNDGSFRLTIYSQGRCRLHATVGWDMDLEPVAGLAPKVDVMRPDGEVTGVRFAVRRDRRRAVTLSFDPPEVDLGAMTSVDRVVAVGDELAAAGLRVGDTVISATREGRPLQDRLLFHAGWAPWGERLTITVKRGNATEVVRATAPIFSSPP